MIRYVGLDVHKEFIEVCVIDRKGNVLSRSRADCRRESLVEFAKTQLRKTDCVALEATTNTWPVVEILRPYVARIVVGNPLKTKAIAEAKIKTDKVDAEVLAQLMRCDYLPDVWQPDDTTQTWRSLVTHRTGLMGQRARHKNRIQCLLGRLLVKSPCTHLWSKVGLAWLKAVPLAPANRLILESELRLLDQVEQELLVMDQQLVEIARGEPRVQLLMTLPGVNYVVALGLLAALGDISRFCDGDHVASYLRLVPITRQSARKCYHGHITKAGNPQARWLLTQACQHVARHPGPLGAFFRRLAKRKPRQVALMAVARKLTTVAFLMLKHNEPYRYARPERMADKFTKLRSRHRTDEAAETSPSLRPAARSGLSKVYEQVGLPPVVSPEDLPAGEQQMLSHRKLTGYVQELYQPAKPKPRKTKERTRAAPQ